MLSSGVNVSMLLASLAITTNSNTSEKSLSIAMFQVDATPPVGSPLCMGLVPPAKKILDPLTARGIVLLTDELPIVLCAVDWVEIGNGGLDHWRQALADSAGTTIDRVSVHTIHPHDTPGHNFSEEELKNAGTFAEKILNIEHAVDTVSKTAEAVRLSLSNAHKVTHIGIGKAKVEKVASNRRLLGANGKVEYVRYSSCQDEKVCKLPEGVIDPYLRNLSFWDEETPIASLTYYATHPQSFYGRGVVSPDFVGMARGIREATLPDVAHIHFDGAGGNLAAGKYNDGSPKKRLILARRLLKGMETAWENSIKIPINTNDIEWRMNPLALPLSKRLENATDDDFFKVINDPKASENDRINATHELIWCRRCRDGYKVNLTCLKIGSVYVLNMPGELFIEYQLSAQEMRPNDTVCVSAYGDCGPGYIGTEISYSQGGYETGIASRVAPEVEKPLMDAIRELLT